MTTDELVEYAHEVVQDLTRYQLQSGVLPIKSRALHLKKMREKFPKASLLELAEAIALATLRRKAELGL